MEQQTCKPYRSIGEGVRGFGDIIHDCLRQQTDRIVLEELRGSDTESLISMFANPRISEIMVCGSKWENVNQQRENNNVKKLLKNFNVIKEKTMLDLMKELIPRRRLTESEKVLLGMKDRVIIDPKNEYDPYRNVFKENGNRIIWGQTGSAKNKCIIEELRRDPCEIIIGEVRGEEAMEILSVMTKGYANSVYVGKVGSAMSIVR